MLTNMNSKDKTIDTTIDTATQLHRSSFRLLRLLRALPSEKGFGLARLGVLTQLYNQGVSTATQLAGYLRIRPQSVTRMLAQLEKDEYITRRLNDEDRRQTLIEITESGKTLLLKEGRGQQTELARIIEATLTPAEQEMLRLAAGLMDQLAEGAETKVAKIKTKK